MTAITVDLDDLKAQLADRVEDLALELFGPPKPETRRGRNWLFPGTGGVSVCVRGPKKGLFYWHSGAGTDGGSMLDAIAFARSCSIPEAIEWAKGWLGIDDAAPLDPGEHEQRRRERDERARQAASGSCVACGARASYVSDTYLIAGRQSGPRSWLRSGIGIGVAIPQ